MLSTSGKVLIVVATLVIGHGTVSTAQSCTLFGNTDATRRSDSSAKGLFLDLQNPAPCSGTVTAWNYCFYRLESSSDITYIVDFVVYRRIGNSGNYQLVDSSRRTVAMTGDQLTGNFRCNVIPLQELEMFEIQKDDVLGACLNDAGNDQKMLDIIAEGVTNTLYVTDGCIESGASIATRITRSQLTTSPSFALHLFVDVTQPPPSTSLTSELVFPHSTSRPATLEISVPVTTTRSTLIGSPQDSTVSSNTQPFPRVSSSVLVSVVATATGSELIGTPQNSMVSSSTQPFPRVSSSLQRPVAATTARNVLVDSTQDSVDSSNTQPSVAAETSPASSTNPPSTTDQAQLRTDGLNSGIVAAIVIVVLALVVSATVVVGIIVCFMRQRRYHQFKAKGANKFSGIDNVVYNVTNGAHVQLKVPEDQLYEVIYSGDLNKDRQGQYDFDTYSKPMDGFDSPVYYSSIGYVSDYFELLEQNKEKDIYAEQSPYLAPATRQEDLYAQIKSYGIRNIPREEVETVSHLGSGQFGNVDRGLWRSTNKAPVEVALKSLTEGASDLDEVKFLQEAVIMAQFEHPNVISLHGVVSTGKPIILVVELVHKGDLRECLTFMRPNAGDPSMPQQLLKYSQQVALGMHYLSSKGFVHRDLAARNILVSQNNICKVADFGMSRDLADETYYVSHGGKIPVKWTAPEALNYRKYSTASDVWSYGCLLYEIWSLGYKPFEGIRNQEVIRKVNSGYRLPPPPGCPRVIYELMIMNWHPDSSLRPGFRDLLLALLQNVEAVLAIPEDALATHAQASVIGAPLEAGEQMYHDLQQTYMKLSQPGDNSVL